MLDTDDSRPPPLAIWSQHQPESRAYARGQLLNRVALQETALGLKPARQTAFSYAFPGHALTTHLFPAMSIYRVESGLHSTYKFNVITEWVHPTNERVTEYNQSGAGGWGVESETTYVYGNPQHAQLTEIRGPSGARNVKTFKYPADYNATGTGGFAALLAEMADTIVHMPGVVIEQTEGKFQGDYHRGRIRTYSEIGPDRYAITGIWRLYSETPLSYFAFTKSSANGAFAMDSRYVRTDSVVAYDDYGRPTTMDDGLGNRTTYEFGGNVNDAFLTRVTQVNPSGDSLATTVEYADGYVELIEDPAGTRVHFDYDALGRLDETRNHDSVLVSSTAYAYGAPVGPYSASNPNAVTTDLAFDTMPATTITTRAYFDGLGIPIQTATQGGSQYLIQHNDFDDLRRAWRRWRPFATSSAGFQTTAGVDAATAYAAACPGETAQPYTETHYNQDALSRVMSVTKPYCGSAADSMSFRYDAPSSLVTRVVTKSEVGDSTRVMLDNYGRETLRHVGWNQTGGHRTDYTYDPLGQLERRQRGFNVVYEWSTMGLMSKRTHSDTGILEQKFDRLERLRFSQDANQKQSGLVEFNVYDFAGRVLHTGERTATFATLVADSQPVAQELSAANWNQTFAYDAAPATTTAPWSTFASQINALTLANTRGRLAGVATKSNGAWQVSLYSYDAEGRIADEHTLTQASGGGSVLTALNTHIAYEYTVSGAVKKRSVTVGSHAYYHWYEFDAFGRVGEVFTATTDSKPAAPAVTYTYNAAGQVASRQFVGGPTVPVEHTIRGEIAEIGDVTSATYPFSASYAYNPTGTVESAEFHSPGVPSAVKQYGYSYTYDPVNRLDSASTFGFASDSAFMVNEVGYGSTGGQIRTLHRYNETGTRVDQLTFSNDYLKSRPRAVSDNAPANLAAWDVEDGAISYDANGNMTGIAGAPYFVTAATYDHNNQAESVTAGGVTSTFRSGAAGVRIAKKEGSGAEVFYVLEGTTTLGTFSVSGSSVTSHEFNIVGPSGVVGRQPATGNALFYHTDMLGTVRAVTDGTTIREAHDYYPFGMPMPGRSTTTGANTREGFTGQERDAATNLDDFGARFYVPGFGIFGSADPLADAVDFMSPYGYANNDPLRFVDPTGMLASTVLTEADDIAAFWGAFTQGELGGSAGGLNLSAYSSGDQVDQSGVDPV